MLDGGHTILLVQTGSDINTRSYSDYETTKHCIEGVTQLFEEYLKYLTPSLPEISYEVSELLQFIDKLADISCLVYEKSANMYKPYNKDWIKQKVYEKVTAEMSHYEGEGGFQ